MTTTQYEIRVCRSCGLRYPLVENHPFGTRCPVCLGETRVVRQERGERKEERKKMGGEGGVGLAVLVDNVRSGWNVGSILRSADGFGCSHAFLCGITPAADNEAVTKTSLGAEDAVPWSYHRDAVRLARGLKAEGWALFALEDDPRALPLDRASLGPGGRTALIVGSEVTGVDPDLLDLCDEIFYIPMRGKKTSFNVAIAFGIAAYALTLHRPEPE